MVKMKEGLTLIWQKWMFVSEKLGTTISMVTLTILYFTIFAILGITIRLLSDKLKMKRKYSSYWEDTTNKVPKNLEESRNQG